VHPVLDAAKRWNLPLAHSVHVGWLLKSWNCPAAHALQLF
jgi:hypothetical protein